MDGMAAGVVGVAIFGREVESALALPVCGCNEARDDSRGVFGSAAAVGGALGIERVAVYEGIEEAKDGLTLANKQMAGCIASTAIAYRYYCRRRHR